MELFDGWLVHKLDVLPIIEEQNAFWTEITEIAQETNLLIWEEKVSFNKKIAGR